MMALRKKPREDIGTNTRLDIVCFFFSLAISTKRYYNPRKYYNIIYMYIMIRMPSMQIIMIDEAV